MAAAHSKRHISHAPTLATPLATATAPRRVDWVPISARLSLSSWLGAMRPCDGSHGSLSSFLFGQIPVWRFGDR
eukprot:2972488-Prymnesium_polylepis.1